MGIENGLLGIKLVGEGEEQWLESGVTVTPKIQRPGFAFSEELQVPIKEINAPVPVVTYPFPVVDMLLEPRKFKSTEITGEQPAAIGGRRDNLTNPLSPVIPAFLFQGKNSGIAAGKVSASTATASARNQSAQLGREFSKIGIIAFVGFAAIMLIALVKG